MTATPPAPQTPSRTALAGLRVLVVEDEPLIALDLRLSFEDAGAEVAAMHSVETTLRFLDRAEETGEMPDVAVLDVSLGRGTTCVPIAGRLSREAVPFVLHSGNLDRAGELLGRIEAPVVAKPAPDGALVRAVVKLLGRDGAPMPAAPA